jgi:hypothetical protein
MGEILHTSLLRVQEGALTEEGDEYEIETATLLTE